MLMVLLLHIIWVTLSDGTTTTNRHYCNIDLISKLCTFHKVELGLLSTNYNTVDGSISSSSTRRVYKEDGDYDNLVNYMIQNYFVYLGDYKLSCKGCDSCYID